MAIEQRGGTWWFRFQWHGQEQRRSTGLAATASNLTKAQAMETEHRYLLQRGKGALVRRVAFRLAAEEFLTWCDTTEYPEHPSTAARIRTSFASLVTFLGDVYVCDIRSADVEQYKSWRLQEHHVRSSTLRNDLQNLSLFFNRYATRRRLAEGNPVADVSKPSTAGAMRIHVLTAEEEAKYFPAALAESKNLHDLAKLILLTGARPEEILSARKENFNAKARTLFIPGGKTRTARRLLSLTPEAFELLVWRSKQHPKNQPANPWLFPSHLTGRHLVKLNAQHDQVCLDSGVSFCLYDLRHTFATRMVEAGVELPTLASILGHSGLTMVMRYVHPTAASQADAMRKYQTWMAEQPDNRRTRRAAK
jgi:integrase